MQIQPSVFLNVFLTGIFFCLIFASVGAFFVGYAAKLVVGVKPVYSRALGITYLAYLSTFALALGIALLFNLAAVDPQHYSPLIYPVYLIAPAVIFAFLLKKPAQLALQPIGFLNACKIHGLHLCGMLLCAAAYWLTGHVATLY